MSESAARDQALAALLRVIEGSTPRRPPPEHVLRSYEKLLALQTSTERVAMLEARVEELEGRLGDLARVDELKEQVERLDRAVRVFGHEGNGVGGIGDLRRLKKQIGRR